MIVDTISEDTNVFEAPEMSSLRKRGHVLFAEIASVYLEQGKKDEAEGRLKQEVEDFASICGNDHLIVQMLEFSLARIYAVQERWDDCEKMELRSLKTSEEKLGIEHTSTLTGMLHLATTYKTLGRWSEAIELEKKVEKISASKFGRCHPDTWTSMNNLGFSYWQRSQFHDAEKLFTELKDMTEQELGPEHPFTLKVMSNLACVYRKMNRLDEALALEQQAIEASEDALGDDHPVTLNAMSSHASTLSAEERFKEALVVQEEVLERMGKKKLPPSHDSVLLRKGNIAETYYELGDLTKAGDLEREVLDGYLAKYGLHHHLTLYSYYNLARTRKRQGRLAEALDLIRICAGACVEVCGPDHELTRSCQAYYWLWSIEHGVRSFVSFLFSFLMPAQAGAR